MGRSLKILVVCNSSCVHKRQRITSSNISFSSALPQCELGAKVIVPDLDPVDHGTELLLSQITHISSISEQETSPRLRTCTIPVTTHRHTLRYWHCSEWAELRRLIAIFWRAMNY
ncbi:hypothetical protein L873DRAFT_1796870 [Choiromyces venosus 120613-1]|uniref:Uncharacterized protein n=1 Tax=Choiromyces venosus 120613-1 TaxID=1336337 RepID=A0A3N4K626_9PEZI|nr:hypothetical protein L873DRAFT_1796870 [Choiromyces venosus 120613-1]